MTNSMPVTETARALEGLAAARERLRVEAYLFSTDELERWWEIEDELAAIETQAENGGEAALAAVADKTRELVRMTSAFLEQHTSGNISLWTPAHRVMTVARCACLASDSISYAARSARWMNPIAHSSCCVKSKDCPTKRLPRRWSCRCPLSRPDCFALVNNSNGHWRNGDEPTSFATTTASVARDR